ncbi:phosphoglycerate kinase [Natronoarchaeum philippinense]|uniref:Phosphoglycerate kinase n=1 Tax=Natronoarchaeum philippinense TaxID=558529 RepID=A0A285NQC8_NATPI|nr:phosphoglycerate kinase [Natronoarchaeum philippinense]SNZ11675.1 phosphoglycerate kinase [Natronoarchaeum philippinense]
MFNTIDDLDSEQRLLMRVDLNAPVDDGDVQDNRRFARHAETVAELTENDHAVALMAHQGRPGRDTFVTLEQHADILADHLDHPVEYVPSTYGEEALDATEDLESGDVLMLENVRMTDEELADLTPEEHGETEFVQTLAPEFDAYVNDGYSVAHRAHTSIVGFPQVMDSYAGSVMEDEYEYNTSIERREFDGKVTMALGGTKAEDVIAAMENLDEKVDQFLLGGIVGHLFLRAKGYEIGIDTPDGPGLYDESWEENEETIREVIETYGDRISLPVDVAREGEDGERVTERVENADHPDEYMDVGEATIDEYRPHIEESEAVLVKGALGVFEMEQFSYGTRGVLEAIAETDCYAVVGGGDTSRAVEMYDIGAEHFDHLSIAGGAYLRALTGAPLPAVEALEAAAER